MRIVDKVRRKGNLVVKSTMHLLDAWHGVETDDIDRFGGRRLRLIVIDSESKDLAERDDDRGRHSHHLRHLNTS